MSFTRGSVQISNPTLEEIISDSADPDVKDQQISSLQIKIQDLENKVLEERFVWILVSVVLVDSIIFSLLENWTGPLVIGLFELFGIVILADRFKIDAVSPLIDKFTGVARRFTNSDNGNGGNL